MGQLIIPLAVLSSALLAVQLITATTNLINTNEPMILDKNIAWSGEGDLETYHLTNGIDAPGEACILTPKGATRCFKKSGQKYRFGKGFPVTETVNCPNVICQVETQARKLTTIRKEKWTNISGHDAINLISKFIPDKLNYAKSAPFIGKPLAIQGPGSFRISFKSIQYLLEGTFTANYFNGQVSVINKTFFCIPLKLKDGSMDGIYVIDKA
ncbi:hypothetical protein DSO57_1014934 [Entomophthora muscae]|uniref:Uncharacterized protein n=2 Tax=Entomophthora muscae TaxID=34485 RepID=A0ACC2S655_9FUNG|nr:hypothetical protein DSO57_1019134 [Entomophthora muscae]KAJ9081416.1 hypothetical protein DSO57_1014934 [Entomophthora muscae]